MALAIIFFLYIFAIAASVYFCVTVARLLWGIPPFVPVSKQVVHILPTLLPLKENGVFYDLGSGEGRVVAALAQAFPNARCTGVEADWLPFILSRVRFPASRMPNARFVRQNFFETPLKDATHVFLYVFPKTMDVLYPKLEQELTKGAVVVSCDFTFTKKAPEKIDTVGAGRRKHSLYTYRF